jgi:hypothetical protein
MRRRITLLTVGLLLCSGLSAGGQPKQPAQAPIALEALWSRGKASGKGSTKLTNFLLRTEDIDTIIPMGMMVWGHVTPSDHLSVQPKDRKAPKGHYPVMAPADGFIVDIQRPPAGNPDPAIRAYSGDYRIVIEHSGTFYSWFGLVDKLDQSVLGAIGGEPKAGPSVGVRVPVKAGQTVAWTGGSHGLDFTVLNTESTLKGFVNPRQFQHRDPWKPHVVDPFEYLDEPLKSQLLKLNPRKAEPRGGKIDHDAEGKLVGNWYREGSGGYAGADRRLDYWVGHLALGYHHIDPTKLIVSLGDFEGKPRQFWVKGNDPDPATVGEKDGEVKYELVYGAIDNSGRPYDGIDTKKVHGVLLVQVLPNQKLQVEVFPGKTADNVKGFTKAAFLYER